MLPVGLMKSCPSHGMSIFILSICKRVTAGTACFPFEDVFCGKAFTQSLVQSLLYFNIACCWFSISTKSNISKAIRALSISKPCSFNMVSKSFRGNLYSFESKIVYLDQDMMRTYISQSNTCRIFLIFEKPNYMKKLPQCF